MVKDMKILCLLILVVGATHSFEYEHVEDSCNSIARYMSRKPDEYTLRFSKEPGKPIYSDKIAWGTTVLAKQNRDILKS